MTKREARRLVSAAQTEIVQAREMLKEVPPVETTDRALHYLTNGMEKLADAIEALAEE